MIEIGASHSIICSALHIREMAVDFVIAKHESCGYYSSPSVFGKYIVVSDTVKPTTNSVVVSSVERDGFVKIDVDEDWLSFFCFIHEVENEDLVLVMKTIPKYKPLIDKYALFLSVLGSSFDGKTFDRQRALDIVQNRFEHSFSLKEQISTLVNFVNHPDVDAYTKLNRVFHGSNFGSMVKIVQTLVDDDRPSYYSKHDDIVNTEKFTRNLLKVAVALLKTERFEDAMLKFSQLVR